MLVFNFGPSGARRGILLLVFWATLAGAQAAAPRIAVADLLRSLTATGVDVLYSSDLVPPGLDAPDTLPRGDPRSRVDAALAANQLMLRDAGAGRFIVSRTPRPKVVPGVAPKSQVAPASAGRPISLAEMSVFASRYEVKRTPSGEPLGFGDQELADMPGGRSDSVRALHGAPGLATNLSARPYVRGALLEDVLIQYDGVTLAEPFHFRDFQSVMSLFDPAAVNRADVYTGEFPAK